MSQVTEHQDVASGTWKFIQGVRKEELIQLAKEWKDGPDGDRYLDLSVRQDSRKTWCISFKYRLDPDSRGHTRFFQKTLSKLKRHPDLGPNVAGWDISSPTWIIS